MNSLIKLTSVLVFTSQCALASIAIDPQADLTAIETYYDVDLDSKFELDESYTLRTGQWKCIAKDIKKKSFTAFHADQEQSMQEAMDLCQGLSKGCKKISCHTN